MEFGIFSNGFRPHTSASQTYEEDLAEIVLADQLGFRDAYISEHHGEPVYIDKIDTLPVPELLMCKAAALTKQIRMGAAVKLIHRRHPVDTALSEPLPLNATRFMNSRLQYRGSNWFTTGRSPADGRDGRRWGFRFEQHRRPPVSLGPDQRRARLRAGAAGGFVNVIVNPDQ
jgi:hypothetical protein